jgi:hypothetical protein
MAELNVTDWFTVEGWFNTGGFTPVRNDVTLIEVAPAPTDCG